MPFATSGALGMGIPSRPSQALVDLLGEDENPLAAQPSTRLQQSLMRNISPRYAVNRWFMALLGAAIATGIGLLITLALQSVIAKAISSALASAFGNSSTGSLVSGIASSTLTPDVLKLFMVELRIPLTLTMSANVLGADVGGSITIAMPLSGYLLIPAISLFIGGFISAASDFRRTGAFSTFRGALIGVPYAVIVTILALVSSSSAQTSLFGASVNATIAPSAWQAFIYALLWGIVFGGIGGWAQLVGSGFLREITPALRARYGQTLRGARAVGAIVGALVSVLSSVMVSVALLLALLSFTLVIATLAPSATATSNPLSAMIGSSGGLGLFLLFVAIIAPTLAIYVFALSVGTTIGASTTGLPSASGGSATSIGLLPGQMVATSPLSQYHYLYLLMLIPLVCFLAGGRVAARAAAAKSGGDSIIAGALMAIPASIVFTILSYLVTVGVDVSAGSSSVFSSSVGPALGGVFLSTLIGGLIVGGIGGWTNSAVRDLSRPFRLFALPALPLGGWLGSLLDQLTAAPQGVLRSTARVRLYDAILALMWLGALAIVLDIGNHTIAASVPFSALILIDAIVAALLVFLPSVLLVASLVTEMGFPAGALPAADISTMAPPLAANQFELGGISAHGFYSTPGGDYDASSGRYYGAPSANYQPPAAPDLSDAPTYPANHSPDHQNG